MCVICFEFTDNLLPVSRCSCVSYSSSFLLFLFVSSLFEF